MILDGGGRFLGLGGGGLACGGGSRADGPGTFWEDLGVV